MLELRKINRDNFDEVIGLSVFEDQKSFVASNLFSLAQAKVFPECLPMAIYLDDSLIGFVMYGIDCDDNEYWISRLMIDKKYQKKGYGLAAMKLVLEELWQDKDCERIFISFEPENAIAKALYEKLGFIADGRIIDGEIVYLLDR